MKTKDKEKGKKVEALNTPTPAAVLASTSDTTAASKDLGASPEAEGWKDVLQLLRKQNKKMEKLARALSVIQQGMLRNNPGHVKDSVKESTEVLSGMSQGKVPRRTPTARLGDAVRVSAKDGESYAEILKTMKARVNPQNSGTEVLSIRRTRREEILLVLRKGGDVSAFEKALEQAVWEKAEIKSLVLKRSLEVKDLDETVTREEVVAALCIALGKPDLGDQCRLYKRFGGVQTAVVGELPHPRACRGCPVFQVPGIWPCVPRLHASRQERFPRERKGSPEPSDADCQGAEGRCVAQ